MSDGLPTEQQLRRIEDGVRHRIDARRAAVRRVLGGTVTAVLVVGALGGLITALMLHGGSSSSGGGSSAAGSAADPAVVVRCHERSDRDSPSTAVKVPDDRLPGAAAAACGSVADLQSGTGRAPAASSGARDDPATAAPAPSSTPAPGSPFPALSPSTVLCRAVDGDLHLYPADAQPGTLCVRNGMRPY